MAYDEQRWKQVERDGAAIYGEKNGIHTPARAIHLLWFLWYDLLDRGET